MKKEIGILHLEDSLKDSELIHSTIDGGEIKSHYFLTDNEKDYLRVLETENIDIILSDYSLPDFNGNEALKVARERYPHVPFIFVSGTLGEDAAIIAMKNGARDYVLKNKMERLVPAILRALNEQNLISKDILAVAALKESERLLNQAQKLAHLGVWTWVAETDSVTWTEELYHIAGLDPMLPAPAYKAHSTLYTAESWNLQKAAVEIALKTGEPYELELELIRPDKTIRNVMVLGGPKADIKGKIVGLYGTVQDITERKVAETELIDANKELVFQNKEREYRQAELILAKDRAEQCDRLKSAFLANMSHEIRTPMNGILGFAELLKEPDLTGDEQQKYIEIIEKSGARMLSIINNIVDISKIESGLMKVDISEMNINDKIEFIHDFFKSEAAGKGIALSLSQKWPEKEAIIKTDAEKLYSIIANLVKNAIINTNAGTIELGYQKKGEFLEFFVKDTGIGIPLDRQRAIFERFVQADIVNKQAKQGAGLGLSITKAYVEMLGGKLWLESKEGEGSAFYFNIPCIL